MTPRPVEPEARRSVRRELKAGFAYVRANAWIWATLCAASLALLASWGPYEVLLPYIIRNDLGGDAAVFGVVLPQAAWAPSSPRWSSHAPGRPGAT